MCARATTNWDQALLGPTVKRIHPVAGGLFWPWFDCRFCCGQRSRARPSLSRNRKKWLRSPCKKGAAPFSPPNFIGDPTASAEPIPNDRIEGPDKSCCLQVCFFSLFTYGFFAAYVMRSNMGEEAPPLLYFSFYLLLWRLSMQLRLLRQLDMGLVAVERVLPNTVRFYSVLSILLGSSRFWWHTSGPNRVLLD